MSNIMDKICCWNTQTVVDSELVDTYGGDYTYMDVFACKECGRVFEWCYGAKESFEEVYDEEDKERYLAMNEDGG